MKDRSHLNPHQGRRYEGKCHMSRTCRQNRHTLIHQLQSHHQSDRDLR